MNCVKTEIFFTFFHIFFLTFGDVNQALDFPRSAEADEEQISS